MAMLNNQRVIDMLHNSSQSLLVGWSFKWMILSLKQKQNINVIRKAQWGCKIPMYLYKGYAATEDNGQESGGIHLRIHLCSLRNIWTSCLRLNEQLQKLRWNNSFLSLLFFLLSSSNRHHHRHHHHHHLIIILIII